MVTPTYLAGADVLVFCADFFKSTTYDAIMLRFHIYFCLHDMSMSNTRRHCGPKFMCHHLKLASLYTKHVM